MKYDPNKALYYYDEAEEVYKEVSVFAVEGKSYDHLYQWNKLSGEYVEIDDLATIKKDAEKKEEEKVDVLYEKALTAFKKEEKKVDNVNHPKHYDGSCSIECIDAMRFALGDEGLAFFCAGNAFKYLWRYKFKNGQEDLDKAGWYRDRLLNLRLVNPVENDAIKELNDKVSKLYLTVTGKEENAAFEGEDEEDD